jgi:hypothetical protein
MRSMVEGQVRVKSSGAAGVTGGAMAFFRGLPLHQLRWFPSPFRGGFKA